MRPQSVQLCISKAPRLRWVASSPRERCFPVLDRANGRENPYHRIAVSCSQRREQARSTATPYPLQRAGIARSSSPRQRSAGRAATRCDCHSYRRCDVLVRARAHRVAANAQRSRRLVVSPPGEGGIDFQSTLTAAFCVCAMAGWAAPRLAFWLFVIVLAFDLLFSLTAAVKSAFGERYVYPVKLTIVR